MSTATHRGQYARN